MPRIGTILEVIGDHAVIETTRRGICDGCSDHGNCAMEGAADSGLVEKTRARNPIGAEPGDRVAFELTGHTELKLSLLIWVVPLIGLVTGAVLATSLHQTISFDRDLATLLGALLGGALAFGVVILIDRRARGDARLLPEIVKVVAPSTCSMTSDIGPG
jgi:sigma-E factor negative regulatory protein RseC